MTHHEVLNNDFKKFCDVLKIINASFVMTIEVDYESCYAGEADC